MSNQFLNHLLSDEFEKDALAEITKALDEEIAKPAANRDYDKIKELTDAYTYLSGKEDFVQEATERGIQKLTTQTRKPRIRMTKRIRIMIAVACATLVLLTANAFTVAAWDMDVFTAIIHFTKDSFSVDFPESEAVELLTSEDDPYGIKAECVKYGMEVEAPTYLPEGFVLKEVKQHVNSEDVTTIYFHFFRNEQEVIVIDYQLYDDISNNNSVFPSDNFNLSEISVNGKTAIVSKEDDQYTIVWTDGNMQTIIYTYNLDYEESDKIVASLK